MGLIFVLEQNLKESMFRTHRLHLFFWAGRIFFILRTRHFAMISCHKICHHQQLLQRTADVLLIWMCVGEPGPCKAPGKFAKTNRAKWSEQFNLTGATDHVHFPIQHSGTSRDTRYRFMATLRHTENISDSLGTQMHPCVEVLPAAQV